MVQSSSTSALSRPVTTAQGSKFRFGVLVSILACALLAGGLLLGSVQAIENETETCEPPVTPTHPFSDVEKDSFAYDAVACIFLLGITTGTTPTTFSPNEYVTREQMASFMARIYQAVTGSEAPVVSTPFTDMPSDSFAHDDIGRLYGLGITTGSSPTTYSPYWYVTREEMASFLARLYRAVYGQDAPVELTPFFDVPLDSYAYDDIGRIYGLGLTTGTTTTTYSPNLYVTRESMAAFLARFHQLPDPATTTNTATIININANDAGGPIDPPSPPQDDTTDNDTADNDSSADESPSSRDIAFVRTRVGTNGEIWVVDEDGSNAEQVGNTNNSAEDPTLSPDGTKIVFTSTSGTVSKQLWMIDTNGSNLIQLTEAPNGDPNIASYDPAWSPDGTKIAFVSLDDLDNYEIFVMNADGSDLQQVTSNHLQGREPSWSPDGTKIAFSRTNGDDSYVWTVNVDGTGQKQISDNSKRSNNPAWSPYGTKIAFTSRNGNAYPQIWVMDTDGSNPTQLTNDFSNTEPAWSPHGQIVYVSDRGYNVIEEIWMMDADGTNQDALTTDGRDEWDKQPVWSWGVR